MLELSEPGRSTVGGAERRREEGSAQGPRVLLRQGEGSGESETSEPIVWSIVRSIGGVSQTMFLGLREVRVKCGSSFWQHNRHPASEGEVKFSKCLLPWQRPKGEGQTMEIEHVSGADMRLG